MKFEPRYWVYEGNVDGQLENGSFYRDAKPPHNVDPPFVQYMNGDFMGFADTIPANRVLVPREHALKLLPKCCRV